MRVLIVATVLACAAGAPLEEINQLLKDTTPAPTTSIISQEITTESPGDIEAAAIDAKVKAEDAIRLAADQEREARELLAENPNKGIIEANDLAKEKSEQAFWNAEEQKWQALDAMKVAEAQADAAAARSSYVASREPAVPFVNIEQAMIKEAARTIESPTKTLALQEQSTLSQAEKCSDCPQLESANLKSAAPEPIKVETQNPLLIQSFPQSPIFVSPLSISPLPYSHAFVAPMDYIHPGLNMVASPAMQPVKL